MDEVAPNGVRYADVDAYKVERGWVHWLMDGVVRALCGHDPTTTAGSDLGPASDWPREQWCRKCFPLPIEGH